MRGFAADWVPDGAWLAPGYAEWPAPAGLRDAVACLWASVVPGDGAGESLVLPDGCSDLIWEQGTGAYVAGPDTAAVRTTSRPGTVFVGVRFRPASGGPVLGVPLSELRDQRVDVTDVLSAAGETAGTLAVRRAVAELAGDSAPAEAAVAVLELAGCLIAERRADPAVERAAVLLGGSRARAQTIAAEAGLSERQFRRRFHAAAGYGPKTLQRVLRFQRFVQRVDAAPGAVDLAAVAAETGYADQAHLTRECKALSGLTPATLFQVRGGQGGLPAQPASGGSPIIAVPTTRNPSLT